MATIIVAPAPIVAETDSYGPVNGLVGATTPSVLANDTLNGDPVDPAEIALTPGVAPTPAAGSITMNANGTITVAPGTTAGTYTYPYTICERLNPTNCSTTTATVVVAPAVIDAVDDSFGPINGFVTTTTPSVVANDTLNGVPVVPANVTVTPGFAPTPAAGSITMNPDGTITVAAGTTAGTYTYAYTVCENLNPTNCDTATATITVVPAVIDAVEDSFGPINGFVTTTTPSVVANDTLNGEPVIPGNVTVTPGTAPAPAAGSITMNADGTITVAAGTTAGTYTYPYTLCENLNPTNCDTAIATVVVAPAVIEAEDDSYGPVNGFVTTTTPSVLDNDTLNGAAVDPAAITLNPGTAPSPADGSITMNGDGTITVAAGTTAGTYTYDYEICENLNPLNCSTATATIVVEPAPIVAVEDSYGPLNGFIETTTPSVLDNDTLNGAAVDPAAITLTPGTAPSPVEGSITMNADGTITVAAGTTAGTYSYDYEICENLNPDNCATATAIIVVEPAPILAVDDSYGPVNGFVETRTAPVVLNDRLNGVPVDAGDITLTPGAAPMPTAGSITMDADGFITIAAGTTAGTYSYDYTICENLNPDNCSTATATIVVEAAPIDAVDDDYGPLNGFVTTTTPSVLGNDTLNGAPVNPALITLTPGVAPTPAAGRITMNADGSITVAAGTTAGSYTYDYTICEILNPSNCSAATATIVVEPAPILAVDDSFGPLNGFVESTTPSVLANDTLNGVAVNPAAVTLTPGVAPTPAAGSITMNPDGTITVAAGTTAGTYRYEYTICEILNPENCSAAVAIVAVDVAPLVAEDDPFDPINGADGGNTPSVLGNDTLNGAPVDPAAITLTPGVAPTPAAGSITMNADGTITVAPGTTAGAYTYPYTICEILNPENCSTATATITIGLSVIAAVDDDLSDQPIAGESGGDLPSVLLNDTLNGVALDPADITLTPGTAPTPAAGSITMNPDGTITIAAGTTAGTYSYEYTICEILNPENCSTATATILVTASGISLDKIATLDDGGDGVANVGDRITYAFTVRNTGTVPLTDVTVSDPQVTVSGGPIASLAAGATDSTTFSAVHVLTQEDLDAGEFENSASVSGTDPTGVTYIDVSDDPANPTNADPDGDGNPDDPTIVLLPAMPELSVEKTATLNDGGDGIAELGDTISYSFTVINTGNVTLTDVSIDDDLVAVTGGPIASMAPGDRDETTFTAVYALTQADLERGRVDNIATASGTDPQGARVTDLSHDPTDPDAGPDGPTVMLLITDDPELDASKSVSNQNPQMGEIITYTLTFENTGTVDAIDARILDELPPAVQYVPDSARIAGEEVDPEVAGRSLVWSPMDIALGESLVITFDARVTTMEAGETAVNRTWATDDEGETISDVAEAEITRRAEHVFDCSDVIGKVFDDRDMDGYQDEGEAGMAGARVVTLAGELITTDEHGRFSLPCAALPGGTGENISLKLDTRSLPTGYRVTTENPRVVRATAGKMVRINFGVGVGKVTDVDLMDAAFQPGSAEMTRPLSDGIAQLVESIRSTPGVIRLSYYHRGEDRRLIDARLDAVEQLLTKLWRDRGRYKLNIERTSKQIQ
ncbi:hypothetical protein [uncultured Paracoccus sp.]|uniref:DUF7507 domain-containing protein n=1 Tax=uncultured Paracoccus sp. TaxID=189685 RepID=UPI00261C672B|nr:hypothetical protein [uncultured Paracoccus sp.]